MDEVELSELLSADVITLSLVAGLMIMAQAKVILILKEGSRRLGQNSDGWRIGACQLRLAFRSGFVAPVMWEAAAGKVAPDLELVRFLGFESERDRSWPRGLTAWFRLVHPDDRGEWFNALRLARQSGMLDLALRLILPDGRTKAVSLRAEFDFADHVPRRMIGLLLDRAASGFEKRPEGDARSGDVCTCLQTSAVLAHELSQPVGVVLGLALAARSGLGEFPDAPPELARKLKRMVEASLDASEVIRRVQARSRGEAIPLRELDVNELVGAALRKLHDASFLRDVETTLQLAEDLPKVRGDAVELTQLLHNLIRNAGEAMAGSNEKALILQTRIGLFDEVCVAVIDRGPGLAAGIDDGSGTKCPTTKPHGLGLGLSICRAIALAHGGSITSANNEDGPGAVFTLTLPAIELVAGSHPDEATLDRVCRG